MTITGNNLVTWELLPTLGTPAIRMPNSVSRSGAWCSADTGEAGPPFTQHAEVSDVPWLDLRCLTLRSCKSDVRSVETTLEILVRNFPQRAIYNLIFPHNAGHGSSCQPHPPSPGQARSSVLGGAAEPGGAAALLYPMHFQITASLSGRDLAPVRTPLRSLTPFRDALSGEPCPSPAHVLPTSWLLLGHPIRVVAVEASLPRILVTGG